MSTIILQKYANREYRLTMQSVLSPQKQKGDKYAEKQGEKYAEAVHNTYVLEQSLNQGVVADYEGDKLAIANMGEVEARQALRSLDIINEFHLNPITKAKGGWGHLSRPTSFTRNARHRLLEAGAIVDQFCGLNAYEITCTLPGSTNDAMQLLAENTGWIMNELTREIRKAKCKYWFYVWELQKRGALHLHMCIAESGMNLQALATRLESRWWELLQSMSNKTGRDAFLAHTGKSWRDRPDKWQSHVAPIQKSVAAYFSKYAGKGLSSSLNLKSSNKPYAPSRWWGCSTEIKAQIKLQRRKWSINLSNKLSAQVREKLLEWLNNKGCIKTYHYDFDLGKTRNETHLGGGEVDVFYYDDEAFARMQTWQEYVWEEVLDIARRHGYADMDTQTWTDADMEAQHILNNRFADMPKALPSPPSQPPQFRRKLSQSRGTQAKPTLDLRARLVKFLAEGMGRRPIDMSGTQTSPNADIDTQTWEQLSIFVK